MRAEKGGKVKEYGKVGVWKRDTKVGQEETWRGFPTVGKIAENTDDGQ